MRYSGIIHLVIIFLGLQSLYLGITYCLGNLYAMVVALMADNSFTSFFSGAPLYFFSGSLTLVLGWLLITKSRNITSFVVTKSGYEEPIHFSGGSKQLLSIFIIFLAISSLLAALPPFLRNIFYAFKETAGGGGLLDEMPKKADWFITILDLLLPCLLIVFCRQLTEYFSKNIFLAEADITISEDLEDEQEQEEQEDQEEANGEEPSKE